MDPTFESFYREKREDVQQLSEVLQAKWRRKQRSPLKFVESYNELHTSIEAQKMNLRDVPEDEPPRRYLLCLEDAAALLKSLRADYEACLPEAKAQKQRNEYWRDIYDPPPMPWRGGKADGGR